MKLALIFALFGMLLGAISGVLKGVHFVCKHSRIVLVVIDLLFAAFAGLIFVYATNIFNMGVLRAYLGVFYAFGYLIERKTLGKLFAKLFLMLYNGLSKLMTHFKTTRFGKIIFK